MAELHPRLGGHTQSEPGAPRRPGRLLAGSRPARAHPCRSDPRRRAHRGSPCAAACPTSWPPPTSPATCGLSTSGPRWRSPTRLDDHGLGGQLPIWSEELLSCRDGDVLMNSPDERGAPHLWGHIQEGVLAEVAVRLGRDDWLAIAAPQRGARCSPARSRSRIRSSPGPAVRRRLSRLHAEPPGGDDRQTLASAVWSRSRAPGSTDAIRPAGRSMTAARDGWETASTVSASARTRAPRPTSSAPRPSSTTPFRWPVG